LGVGFLNLLLDFASLCAYIGTGELPGT
jgi:hypothetical protein